MPPKPAGLGLAHRAAADDHLGTALPLGFQQHRVHVVARRDLGGHRLQPLRAADFATIGGDRGIVGHILRFERANRQAALTNGARQPGGEHRFTDIGTGAL